jgi:potassium efflux system protein
MEAMVAATAKTNPQRRNSCLMGSSEAKRMRAVQGPFLLPSARYTPAVFGLNRPSKISLLALCLIVSALWLPVVAESEDAPESQLDLEEVRALREQAEGNAALGEDLQRRILEALDEAIGSLEAAAVDQARAAEFDRERAQASGMVDALEAELRRSVDEPRLTLAESATTEQVEARLARERSRLAAYRSALRGAERLAEERAGARNEIAERLGTLDQEIESISDQLRSAAQRHAHPELVLAARIRLLARRDAATGKQETLRAELALLDARGPLIPWKIDQGQRRVEHSETLVELLHAAAQARRRNDDEASLERIREQCHEAAELADSLGEVAAETQRLAETLWGADSVGSRSEETVKDLLVTRKHISNLDRIDQLTRRKFETVGYRGNVTRWWPVIPEDFPKPGDAATILRDLKRRIPDVQHELIQLEQQRASSRELTRRVLADLDAEQGHDASAESERAARELFAVRRELLGELIQVYGRYSSQLVELESVLRNFLSNSEQLQGFLFERLLWARSVPRPIVPRPGDLYDAFLWLNSWQNWKEAFSTATQRVVEFPARALGLLLGFGLLVGSRRSVRRRMATLAERAEDADSFRATAETFLHTLLLAAPLPLALYLCSGVLSTSEASTFVFSAAQALGYVASIAVLLEISRQLLAPNGLAEVHFGWPSRVTRSVHRGLLWPEIVFLPLIQVAIHFVMAGQRLSSPQELQVYNNSLGRVVFIVAMTVFGLSLLSLFRPRKQDKASGKDWRSARLYMYAYPITMLTTLLPALLAVLGYYVTGLLLAHQLLRTLWLATGLLLVAGLLLRWSRTRISHESTEHAEAQDGVTGLVVKAQIERLIRVALIVTAALGLYTIWSAALPELQILKRVQIWPTVTLLEAVEAREVDTVSPPETMQGETGSVPAIPGIPTLGSQSVLEPADRPSDSVPLTLWGVLKALLAAFVTMAVVRNLPGLLEVTLQRAKFDSGARIAIATLARYLTLIVGVSVTFGMLGISWSKIQWLAAALTFGLGFGLQEIVANFVSGLILLVERPVRVGDAVSIGNLQGRVTRIQIRATTIGLWDRSEMIVPNKDFITSNLINWTLTDSKRRLDIPMRVVYGSDVALVKDTLLHVARQHSEVADEPAPQALLLEFGDDGLKFELRCFVEFGQGLKLKDELHMAVDRAFRERNIHFAIPQLSVQIPKDQAPQ